MTVPGLAIGLPPDLKVGPGSQSSIIHNIPLPIQPGWTWVWEAFPEPIGEFRVLFQQGTLEVLNPRLLVGKVTDSTLSVSNEITLPEGARLNIRARVLDQVGQVIEEGLVTNTTWTHTNEWRLNSSTAVSSGLNAEEKQQLQQTHEATYTAISVADLTLQDLTPLGPSGGVVSAFLVQWIYGVIVRIAEVPPEFHVNTADGDYWTRSLAVIRIYRGGDLWKRVPVHTSSKMVNFVEEGIVSAVTALLPIQWLTGLSVQVSFAEGVTGKVFLMGQP